MSAPPMAPAAVVGPVRTYHRNFDVIRRKDKPKKKFRSLVEKPICLKKIYKLKEIEKKSTHTWKKNGPLTINTICSSG